VGGRLTAAQPEYCTAQYVKKKGWKSMINPIALWLKERAGQSTLDGYLDETYRESMEGEARSY
jgi:hypothetical protein